MKDQEVRYAFLTPGQFEQRLQEAPIAYLPMGTLEWHGPHLPLGADGLQSEGVFERLAREAGGIVLPMLFLGPDMAAEKDGKQFYGMDILGHPDRQPEQLPGSAYRLGDGQFTALLESVFALLGRAGFRIVVAHGHGPSTERFIACREEWEQRFGLRLYHLWRQDESDGLGIMTDHAGANETSLMLALYPESVRMDTLPPDPAVWPKAVAGTDPRKASRRQGERALLLQVERMKAILKQQLLYIRGPEA